MNQETLVVDGAYGEGGGQIIRNAVTFACILRRQISVINIRANRPKPGLASQHLESIKAMTRITGANFGTNAAEPQKKDTRFDLNGTIIPLSRETGVDTTIDLVTAGSCTLCIQCILPYLMSLKFPSRIRVIGGTHVFKSPSYDYLERVFLPTFNNLIGNNVKAFLRNPGYNPAGGGCIELEVKPNDGKFKSFNLIERGQLKKIQAIINVPPKMKGFISQFQNMIYPDTRDIEIRIVCDASIEYFVQFENSYAGFSQFVVGKNPNQYFKSIEIVKQELKDFLACSATIDGFMQDQLIIYMALAKLSDPSSTSSIRTIQADDHCTSAIHVSQLFTPSNQFKIQNNEDNSCDIIL